MKRLLSLTLAAALLAALTLPAAAAEEDASQDARLARVTSLVKEALALDTEAYETFRGGLSEELVPVWDLSWEGDRRSLSVSALEDGTVLSLSRWESRASAPASSGGGFPSFPENGGAEDRAAAEAFLARVLRKGEAVELKGPEDVSSLGGSDRSWSGTLVLNGLPSPLRYSIRVEDGLVEHFSRDVPETSAVGGVPAPELSVSAGEAEEALAGTLKLRLEYVREDGGAKAVLRYVPEAGAHTFLADAGTGELLDLTELEEQLRLGYRSAAGGANAAPSAKAEAAADEAGLTKAEQEGVQQMEGVLPKEELDKALRAESAYGLRGYALTGASYGVESGEEGAAARVLCTLRYARTDAGERLTRNITADARTGAVESVQSSAPWGRERALTEEAAQKQAEAFLKALCPDRALALYEDDAYAVPVARGEGEAPYFRFRFARTVNGLPFPEDSYWVSIDGADGSVYGLSGHWDEDAAFDDANGLISMETALSAWAGTYAAAPAYRNVPQKLSKADPAQAKLLERGLEYYYALRLTYGLEREETYSGVDAKTGAPVRAEQRTAREPLSYDDLAKSSARADIEKLAQYGAGYAGGKFRPAKNITQWELTALVYSLQGTALEPETADKDSRENAYYNAYRFGLLRPEERDDNAVLSRADVVRMLLDAAGYGPAARLRGIYTCGYSDKSSIPEENLGYAAMAEALGLASGVYAGERTATRGEAASMLCRVLERAA
nr:S-layer homology domain-containing protein [uncultured Oscillibacter sp.]